MTKLVKAVVTGNVPFAFIESPSLVDACAGLGVKLMSRKTLATKHIPALAEQATGNNSAIIANAKRVDASSDGWRKKHCEQGAALNNIMALLPDRAIFHDAVNVSEMRTHTSAIKQFLIASSKSLVGDSEEDLDRLCDWVLDNTKANWRAMIELGDELPRWIMRGCLAHGINLWMRAC